MRRTKIVATLGPATDSESITDELIAAGVDVVRINFSHGDVEQHRARVDMIRARAERVGRTVGVLADLQGPKIRIDRFRDGKVELERGAAFILDAGLSPDAGDVHAVGVTYKLLPAEVHSGDTLLLDDGCIVLRVDDVVDQQIRCTVEVGGPLSNNKGINRQGGGLSAAALTDKDRADILIAAELKADFLAVSFPRSAADILEARELLRQAGGHGAIVAKIERAEAVDAIHEIITASDVIMIARGDLGVEIGDAELPAVQKRICKLARGLDKVVITATQMMQSMVSSQIPTRAEVFDVANAVLDGTDAVMLSAETATGRYPAKAVAAMARVCEGAEAQRSAVTSDHRINQVFKRTDEAIAMATMYVANHLKVKAIAALTESGATALWMSRISSGIPIYGMTRHVGTQRRLSLVRGVYPVAFDIASTDHAIVNKETVDRLKAMGAVADGDLVVISKGDLMGTGGGTNAMKIVRVGDMPIPHTE